MTTVEAPGTAWITSPPIVAMGVGMFASTPTAASIVGLAIYMAEVPVPTYIPDAATEITTLLLFASARVEMKPAVRGRPPGRISPEASALRVLLPMTVRMESGTGIRGLGGGCVG
jgi:hypothetical protein